MMAHICHLTVLNPAIHTRIFYKLALSQKEMGHQVSIIGQDNSPESCKKSEIHIYPIKPFHRLSWKRLWIQIRILRIALKLKADIYTLHTPELLMLGLWIKWKTGAKLVYDVHEDYQANIRNAAHYPRWLKRSLANMVRRMENWLVKKVDTVVYAEDVYDGMFNLPTEKKYFLRNKFTRRSMEGTASIEVPNQPYMLYTGTLAKAWGVMETLKIWEKMNAVRPIFLVMAGFTHDENLLKEIKEIVENSELKDRFLLVGGREYVPYADIIALIANCEFGTALYEVTPNIKGKIPTKFYEYMAFNKPLIYTDDSAWNEFNGKYALGFSWSSDSSVEEILGKMDSWNRNPPFHQKEDFSWESEEKELERMLGNLV